MLTRRQILQAGSASLVGLGLPRLLASDARNDLEPRADSCIILHLNGGPSHLDTWDMKPGAPAEIRGQFKPIATDVTGVQLCEHLPRLARLMKHCCLLRSLHHSVNNAHAAAVYASLTGHDRGEKGGGAMPTDNPAIGSVLGMLRPPKTPIVPYVSMPFVTKEGAGGPPQPGFFGGLLGRVRDPLFVLRDPNSPSFAMPELIPQDDERDRIDSRRRLLDKLAKNGGELSAFQARAFDLLSSATTRNAFELKREPLAVRERYGRNVYGQSVLLARRLIEAGSRLACISWAPDANATWDTHGQNFVKLKDPLLPQFDAALSSLLEDLQARGLLGRTLVAVLGDFGRTPKVNAAAGRDHWNFCYTLLLAGGGIKGGFVHGASDRIGALPSRNPVTPADLISTIYHCLGIDPAKEIHDRLARPFTVVPGGEVIRELLA